MRPSDDRGDSLQGRHADDAASPAQEVRPAGAGQRADLIAAAPATMAGLLGAAAIGLAYALVAAALVLVLPGPALDPAISLCPANACAAACLLRARPQNEWVAFAAILAGSSAVLLGGGLAPAPAVLLSLANGAEILVTVALIRRLAGPAPNMDDLRDVTRCIWAGGLAAPLVAGVLASLATGSDLEAIRTSLATRCLGGSLAMVVIVPMALLIFDSQLNRPHLQRLTGVRLGEMTGLFGAGMICAVVVFRTPDLPLMFLIPPITLLHACRLGTRCTTFYVLAVAAAAGMMTWLGSGPIAAATASATTRWLLLQLFVAANFLTGLPVSAMLASRAQMFAHLAEGKRQLAMLADNIGDAVLHYDRARVCTYASPSVREVVGVPACTLVGRGVHERLHPDAHGPLGELLDRLYSGTTAHERLTYRRLCDRADGNPVYLEADCRAAHDMVSGQVDGVVVALRDVTERVELEQLLTRARQEAEQAGQAKSDFLASMSHEIRTPMNGVLGFAEMILQGELPPEQRRFAELIVQSGRSLMLLLNDILDLSKIEAGQFTVDEGPVDLYATLAECVALHRPDAARKGLAMLLGCDASKDNGDVPDHSLHHWIITDGLRLRQIIFNLLHNAVKFTDAGTIAITADVTLTSIRIMVRDTGRGIAASRLDSVFAPFHQIGCDNAGEAGGTGLGLSISRKLAQLLGGDITLESAPDKGSCFTVILPSQLVPPQARPVPAPVADAPVRLPAAARILLAEDHDVNRLVISEMLERCGQTVAIAYDGPEAISMVIDSVLRARPYDLVLMDVQMPGCDGYAATRAIRAEGICADTLPIIALTANAFPSDIAAARAAGMQAHLAKPVTMTALARMLQRWLPTRIIEAIPPDDSLDHSSPTVAAASPLAGMRMPEHAHSQWLEQRSAAITAIAEALLGGQIVSGAGEDHAKHPLAGLLHDLAGTAATFGEAELGTRAAALDQALRKGEARDICEARARDLLALSGAAAEAGEASPSASTSR